MSHFGNFTERFSGIPFHHFAQGSLFVVGCGLVVKLPVEVMGVGGVSHHYRTIGGGTFGGNE